MTTTPSPTSPFQFSATPWNRTNPSSPSLISTPPWRRTNISTSPGMVSKEPPRKRFLIYVVRPAGTELRPLLHLEIPIQSTDNTRSQTLLTLQEHDVPIPPGRANDTNISAQVPQLSQTPTSIPEEKASAEGDLTPLTRQSYPFNVMAREFVQSGASNAQIPETEISLDAHPHEPAGQEQHMSDETPMTRPVHGLGSRPDHRTSASLNSSMHNRENSQGDVEARHSLRLTIPTQPRAASHTNSRTWVNPKTHFQSKWASIYRNLKDMSIIKEVLNPRAPPSAIGSFCVPKTFNEWFDHELEVANDRAKTARRRLYAAQEHKLRPRHPDLPIAGEMAPITMRPFGGRVFGDGRSSVLSMPSIWSPWECDTVSWIAWEGERRRPEALWPCEEEMKEEGNERMTSGFRRFLALPRVPGNDTVNWKQKKVLPMLEFDEIWKLPSADTWHNQRVVTSPGETKVMEELIGKDLLCALDCEVSDDL